MQRVHCPRHEERTPSVVVYDDHAWCFGGCGRIALSELGRDVVGRRPTPPENLAERIEYIRGLPRARVRGLDLPVDGDSYYITWPDGSYYKQRKFIPGDGPKYRCPRGHKKPPYIPLVRPRQPTLAIVEGELNALSIASLEPPFSVCSPGGVGDFGEKFIAQCKHFCLQHSRFYVIVDKDSPGIDAAIRTKGLLLKHSPHVHIIAMKPDANELLQKNALKEEVTKWMHL